MPRSPSKLKASSLVVDSTAASPDPDMELLLRHILTRFDENLSSQGAPLESAEDLQEVLELEVNGWRYTVTRSAAPAAPVPVTLSPREQEIVRLVAKGLPNKAIAAVLDISSWTVATHLRRIFAKLEVSTRAEMVARALKAGLVIGGGSESAAN
jgi:DNA-binding CsgD family transcriptional regulator